MEKQKGLAPILIVLLIALVVGGYLIYQKQIKPVVIPQQTSEPSSTNVSPTPTDVGETANWETYENELGFSVKYPTTLDVKSSQDYLTINDPKTFQVNGCVVRNKLRIEMYVQKSDEGSWKQIVDKRVNDPTYHLSDSKTIKVGGLDALRSKYILNKCTDSEVVLLLFKGFLIEISKHPLNSEENSIFDQFLSTFKFLDQNQINNISADDSLSIKKAVFLLPRINMSLDDNNALFAIDQYDGIYAVGRGGKIGSGFAWGATKVNSRWIIVYVEQELPKCSDLDKYSFPKSMISRCNNTKGVEVAR
ncbi:hypothetical protein HYU95_05935 [Candidatus Daviesbacteria bacterium]|nr:hypothetical protein [Candidatus Daviesbacteria bacterium]